MLTLKPDLKSTTRKEQTPSKVSRRKKDAEMKTIQKSSWVLVAHVCNLSYSGG
jgi:hypothetical protein